MAQVYTDRRRVPPGYRGSNFRPEQNPNVTFVKHDKSLKKFNLSDMKEDDLILIGLMLLMLTEDGDDNRLMLLILALIYLT